MGDKVRDAAMKKDLGLHERVLAGLKSGGYARQNTRWTSRWESQWWLTLWGSWRNFVVSSLFFAAWDLG